MVLKSPSPTYWAELKRTHLQNTHTLRHTHTHTPRARGRRSGEMQRSCGGRRNGSPRACRNAQALRAPRSRPGPRSVFLGALPLPSLCPLPTRHSRPPPPPPAQAGSGRRASLPRPSPPVLSPPLSPPTHPPTHSAARRHPQPRARALPAAPRLAARRPRAAAWGKAGGRGKVAVGMARVWPREAELASQPRDAEGRAPSHFLALALPGFAAIRPAGGRDGDAAEVTAERSPSLSGGTGSPTAPGAHSHPGEAPGAEEGTADARPSV